MKDSEKLYYEKRAPEYDDWYLGTGLYAERARRGWHEELHTLCSLLHSLSFRSIVDVACGTGFLTQHLPGRVVGLDQSLSMLEIARTRVATAALVQGDALHLPFRPAAFECLLAGHFYGHLAGIERSRFVSEARRVAEKILIVDSALREDVLPEEVQERVLKNGSRYTVYKRYLDPEQLVSELERGSVLHAGRWFVAVLA